MNFTGANCSTYEDGNNIKSLLSQNTCLTSNFSVKVICSGQKKGMLTIFSTRALIQSSLQAALQEVAAVYESAELPTATSTHSAFDSTTISPTDGISSDLWSTLVQSVSNIAVSISSTYSINDSAGTTSATSEPIVTGRSRNLFMVLFCVVCSLFVIFLLLTCFCFTM